MSNRYLNLYLKAAEGIEHCEIPCFMKSNKNYCSRHATGYFQNIKTEMLKMSFCLIK